MLCRRIDHELAAVEPSTESSGTARSYQVGVGESRDLCGTFAGPFGSTVFEGGCVTWSFDFDNDVPRSELDELDDTLVLQPRSAARDGFADLFPDRDL